MEPPPLVWLRERFRSATHTDGDLHAGCPQYRCLHECHASAAVTVTQAIGTATATVTLSPSTATITNQQSVSVSVSVAGASGQPAPTGNVTLASGSYSAQQPISSGSATFAVPAGALSSGSNTLTAQYSGDGFYSAASGTTTITVAPVVIAVSNPAPVTAGGITTATATFSAGNAYSGTVNLSCALIASPTGAQNYPLAALNRTASPSPAAGVPQRR